MNNTNRGLNRFGIFVVGLVLLVVGAAAAAAAAIPEWLKTWKSVAGSVDDSVGDVVENTAAGPAGQSWLLLAIAAACLVLIVLLAVFIFRQGRGHTRVLVTDAAAGPRGEKTEGAVIIDGAVAEQSIRAALETHPGLMSTSVSTFAVKRTPVLRITTTVRRGVSPQAVRSFVDETVAAWDTVLGREVPVLIQINAGLASRVAKATRVAPGVEN